MIVSLAQLVLAQIWSTVTVLGGYQGTRADVQESLGKSRRLLLWVIRQSQTSSDQWMHVSSWVSGFLGHILKLSKRAGTFLLKLDSSIGHSGLLSFPEIMGFFSSLKLPSNSSIVLWQGTPTARPGPFRNFSLYCCRGKPC